MKILGYGEDCLTLWALQNKLKDILTALGDDATDDECLILYRPSFGRGAGGCFGEFDAMIATPKAVYLCEAKQDGSAEVTHGADPKVKPTPVQCRRHRIFREYFTAAQSQPITNWPSYKSAVEQRLATAGIAIAVPNEHTRLQRSIQFVIEQLTSHTSSDLLIDFVLLVDKTGEYCAKQWSDADCKNGHKFPVVVLDASIAQSGFIPL